MRGSSIQTRRAICAAVILIAAVFVRGGAASAEANEIASAPVVRAVLAAFRANGGFEATFVQTSYWAAFEEADTSRGALTLAPPDRFDIEYAFPPGHRVGSDGRFVWTYLPEDRQVLRADLGETMGWLEPFYQGLESPADSLVPVVRDPRWGEVAVIALTAKPEWGVTDVEARVAIRSSLPVGYAYTDTEGNRIRFDFTSAQFVASVDPERFIFEVPPGYELFDTGR